MATQGPRRGCRATQARPSRIGSQGLGPVDQGLGPKAQDHWTRAQGLGSLDQVCWLGPEPQGTPNHLFATKWVAIPPFWTLKPGSGSEFRPGSRRGGPGAQIPTF